MRAWVAMFILAIIGTIISLLVGIWWDANVAMKLWLSTMAITLMPLWLLSAF